MRVDEPPAGEEAQVDFGLMGYVASADGKRRKLHVLIVTLPMSRYQFVWPTFLQTTEALVEGPDAAWRFFGGATQRVVLDNMSAAIVRASAQDPTINPSFAEYAQMSRSTAQRSASTASRELSRRLCLSRASKPSALTKHTSKPLVQARCPSAQATNVLPTPTWLYPETGGRQQSVL